MPPRQKPGRSKQNYVTPQAFLEAVKRQLGIKEFKWDLAADASNTAAGLWYEHGSLAANWTFPFQPSQPVQGWCWLNPPFANIEPWAKKCWEESRKGCHIAFLVPASVGSDWCRDWVDRKATIVYFLNGRIPFIPDKPKWGYPKDCMLALYQPDRHYKTTYEVWNWRAAS